MPYNPKDPESGRLSIRLPDYDYTQPGAYFITIVTKNRECLFGEIMDGKTVLSPFGMVVESYWNHIPDHFINVETDVFVVMPNHAHGVLFLMEDNEADAICSPLTSDSATSSESNNSKESCRKNTSHQRPGPPSGSIGAIVGNLKSITTQRINKMRHTPGTPVWQRNYFERIIRNERELNAIRQYVLDNPRNWMGDREWSG